MNLITRSPYRKWLLTGLAVLVITAWYSTGYNHPDEHFQILEYANYKMGFSSVKELPWEYATQCRSALQPFIAYCLFEPLAVAGLYNPFVADFILRLVMAVFSWWVICRLIALLLPEFATEKGKKLFVLCSFFLWFVPYIGVRFSAENISGLFFFLALSILLQVQNRRPSQRMPGMLATGLLLGFTIFFRLQIVFAIAGLGVWMLFIKRWALRDWIILVTGSGIAISLSIVADHWFYGAWILTPLNYYTVNIVQHKAAAFGVFPWWYYFSFFVEMAVPPVSIALLFFFFVGVWKKRTHLFSLVCIAFLIGHFLIGHKEMRFLFPVSIAFIFLVAVGLDWLIAKYPIKKAYLWTFRILAAINILLLVVKMFTPAQEVVSYYSFIYNYAQRQNTTLISFGKSPYNVDGLEENFYKPKNLDLKIINQAALPEVLNSQKAVLFLSPTLTPGPELNGYRAERVYCLFPDWLLKYNINHWQDRSRIWAIFRVYPK